MLIASKGLAKPAGFGDLDHLQWRALDFS